MLARTLAFETELLSFFTSKVDDALDRLVRSATRRVYNGFLVTAGAARTAGADFDAFCRECERDHLFVVVVGKLSPPEGARHYTSLGDVSDLESIQKGLEDGGLHLQRLVRVVSDDDPLAYLLHALDPDTLTKIKPGPAFLVARPAAEDTRVPTIDSGLEWHRDVPRRLDYVLLPVPKDGRLLEGRRALDHLKTSLLLTRRLNIGSSSHYIKSGQVLGDLSNARARAAENVGHGLALVRALDRELVEKPNKLFDNKSGAVVFDPDEWRKIAGEERAGPFAELIAYFTERLPDTWSPAHPCMRRILFTPTKVLLRGEEYYINMRKESPFRRFERILDEMRRISTLASKLMPDLSAVESNDDWKLALALFDQIRNISLQTFAFVHAAPSALSLDTDENLQVKTLLDDLGELYGAADRGAHGFVRNATRTYYGWLLHRKQDAIAALGDVLHAFNAISEDLTRVVADSRTYAADTNRSQAPELTDLVRGWREADHPGENLLTSIIAADRLSSLPMMIAVGIGWGGIELPLVFDYVASLEAPGQERHIYLATWSHYRAEHKRPRWDALPRSIDGPPAFETRPIALFDDNTLTGITLERIREDALLHGAGDVQMFITRFSGERRHAHMQMEEHGVVDTACFGEIVHGFLGETPFARSWSKKKKDYKSQIGVFSLSRRRILECIHNNSTVELYDREGF
jgi:hypothetical protein